MEVEHGLGEMVESVLGKKVCEMIHLKKRRPVQAQLVFPSSFTQITLRQMPKAMAKVGHKSNP